MGWWIVQNTVIAALLAGVVLIVVRLTRIGPAGRHLLWLVVLLKLMMPPLVVWPWSIPVVGNVLQTSDQPLGELPASRQMLSGPVEDEARPIGHIVPRETPPRPVFVVESHRTGNADSDTRHENAPSRLPFGVSPTSAGNETRHSASEPTFLPTEPAADVQLDVVAAAPPVVPADAVSGLNTTHTNPADRAVTNHRSLPAPLIVDQLRQLAAMVWWVGILAAVFLQTVRIRRMQRQVRASHAAPQWLQDDVERMAARLGIRAPETRIVLSLSSPAVWAWGRARLLWTAALDEHQPAHGREGVLLHELAHLRRRDHWVGWLDLAAGCLWWWNPLFWFVRQQLHENAELACDAWVVELLPDGRRAYAEALLSVCELSARAPTVSPAVGIGGSNRRNLERRLTMILCERVAFRASWTVLLAVVILAAVTLPGWSQNPPPKPTTVKSADTNRLADADSVEANEAPTEAPASAPVPLDVPEERRLPTASGTTFALPTDSATPVQQEIAVPAVSGTTAPLDVPRLQPSPGRSSSPPAHAFQNTDVPQGPPAERIQQLKSQVQSLMRQIEQLRGQANLSKTERGPRKAATVASTDPLRVQTTPAGSAATIYQLAPPKAAPPEHVLKTETFTLTRTTYKLPPSKIGALMQFVGENVYHPEPMIFTHEATEDGGALTITTTPEVQKTLGELIKLMQRERPQSEKPARGKAVNPFGSGFQPSPGPGDEGFRTRTPAPVYESSQLTRSSQQPA